MRLLTRIIAGFMCTSRFHNGLLMLPLFGYTPTVLDRVFGLVWRAFGTVSNQFYHSAYSFCFLSFASHDEADAAIRSLNDETKLKQAIAAAISSEPDAKGKDLVKKITEMMFVEQRSRPGSLVRASWAMGKTRKQRAYDFDDYDFDEREYIDDCPDGFDKGRVGCVL